MFATRAYWEHWQQLWGYKHSIGYVCSDVLYRFRNLGLRGIKWVKIMGKQPGGMLLRKISHWMGLFIEPDAWNNLFHIFIIALLVETQGYHQGFIELLSFFSRKGTNIIS